MGGEGDAGSGIERDDRERVGLAKLGDEDEEGLFNALELIEFGHRAAFVDDEAEVEGTKLLTVVGEGGAESDLKGGAAAVTDGVVVPSDVHGDGLSGLGARKFVAVIVDEVFHGYFAGGRELSDVAQILGSGGRGGRDAVLGSYVCGDADGKDGECDCGDFHGEPNCSH